MPALNPGAAAVRGITNLASALGGTAGSFSTTSTAYVDLPGAAVTFTTTAGASQIITFTSTHQSLGPYIVYEAINIAGTGETEIYEQIQTHGVWLPTALAMRKTGLPAAATTFKIRVRVTGGTGLWGAQVSTAGYRQEWTLTVMEVAP